MTIKLSRVILLRGKSSSKMNPLGKGLNQEFIEAPSDKMHLSHVYICLSDPCEYNNLAHSNLGIVRKLLLKLIKYQKNALPVWFPERDPSANPAALGGYWGPWMSSTSNKVILQKVLNTIPKVSKKKPYHAKQVSKSEGKIGKVFSTHAQHDEDVYKMLKGILRMAQSGKKGQIPGKNNSSLMKESLAMLFAKMKEKTKVDDLMHKLQMIKKGRVAKGKVHRSRKHSAKSEEHSSSDNDSKLLHKKSRKDDKNAAKRADIENLIRKQGSYVENKVQGSLDKSSFLEYQEQQAEETSTSDASSDAENVEQTDLESGELMNEDDIYSKNQIEDESDHEDETSGWSADFASGTSAKGSGNELQEAYGAIGDVNNE